MKAMVQVLVLSLALTAVVSSVAHAQPGPPREGGGPGAPPSGGGGPDHGGPAPGGGGFGGGRPDHGGGPSHGGPAPGGPAPGGFGGGHHDNSDSSSDSSWDNDDTSWTSSDSSYGSTVYCAPETVSSNVKATDKTLKQLTQSQKFASAKKFNASVAKISSFKNANQKAAAYLDMVGIDAKNSKAIVEFMGAREARGSWLVELQKNSDLTEQQAEQVASALQTTLRGGLQ